MTNGIKTRSGLHKAASRLTLEDLFGPGPLPTPAEISKVAQAEAAKKRQKAHKPADPAADRARKERLASIARAAQATTAQPNWTKAWHPVSRVIIVEQQVCNTCQSVYESPGAEGWLTKYVNKNSGATHMFNPAGPIDTRLPVEKFTHKSVVGVCQLCYRGLVQWPPQSVTILKLEHKL